MSLKIKFNAIRSPGKRLAGTQPAGRPATDPRPGIRNEQRPAWPPRSEAGSRSPQMPTAPPRPERRCTQWANRLRFLRGLSSCGGEDWMRTTDEVAAMLRLKALGWGERRIAVALGCNRRTVRRYLAAEGWVRLSPAATREGPGRAHDWLAERFRRHRRRRAAGSVARGELADGGAGGGGTAPGAAGRGADNDAV
jgi:hypothetical protein